MDEFDSLGEYMNKLRKFPPLLPNQEYNEVFGGHLPFLNRILFLDDEKIMDLDKSAGLNEKEGGDNENNSDYSRFSE